MVVVHATCVLGWLGDEVIVLGLAVLDAFCGHKRHAQIDDPLLSGRFSKRWHTPQIIISRLKLKAVPGTLARECTTKFSLSFLFPKFLCEVQVREAKEKASYKCGFKLFQAKECKGIWHLHVAGESERQTEFPTIREKAMPEKNLVDYQLLVAYRTMYRVTTTES